MKQIISLIALFILLAFEGAAQNIDFENDRSFQNLFIRMYGELSYAQAISTDEFKLGKIDANRFVLLMGYQFDKKTQFVTEWELEHANEIFLEQAFVKHKLAPNLHLKAGVLLIPMGFVNENHEPNFFSSVLRPVIDVNIIPTTWRDIGVGITGLIPSASLKYQMYLVNGLLGYAEGEGIYNAEKTFRSGRQKASKSKLSGLPDLSAKIEYFGNQNFKIGLSYYLGDSNTDAYQNISRTDLAAVASADSTVILSNMLAVHAMYEVGKIELKGQVVYLNNANTNAYNQKTQSNLGANVFGYYAEAAAKFGELEKSKVFLRIANHNSDLGIESNDTFNKYYLTTGYNYLIAKGVIAKTEIQSSDVFSDNRAFAWNTGLGIWF